MPTSQNSRENSTGTEKDNAPSYSYLDVLLRALDLKKEEVSFCGVGSDIRDDKKKLECLLAEKKKKRVVSFVLFFLR